MSSIEEIKGVLQGQLLPGASQLITGAVEKPIEFTVDWESFDNATNPKRAYESLNSLAGYFVFFRAANTLVDLIEASSGADEVKEALDKIVIQNVNEQPEGSALIVHDAESKTLTLRGVFSLGSVGAFSKKELKKHLGAAFHLATKVYRKRIAEDALPRTAEKLQKALGYEVPIEVDWESFDDAEDISEALENLAYWHGYYSFGRISDAVERAVQGDDDRKEQFKKLVQKIVVEHIPGRAYERKHMYVRDGVMHVCGVWERWYWGAPYAYDMAAVLKVYFELATLKDFSSLSDEQHKRKLKCLEEAATCDSTLNGHVSFLKEVARHKAFLQPDAADQEAFDHFIAEHTTGEVLIQGWNCQKQNWRGQEQDRLLVLTDKSVHTFLYNYKKKEVDKKHTKSYTHDHFDAVRISKLQKSGGAPNVPGGAAAQSVANAASKIADALSKDKFVFHYATDVDQKTNPMLDKLLKKAGIHKFVFKVLRKLVVEQLGKIDNQPEVNLPAKLKPRLNQLFTLAGTSLAMEEGELPQVQIPGLPSASVIDALALLKEGADAMDKEPKVALPNMPKLTVPYIMDKLIDVLETVEIGLNIPREFHIGAIMKDLFKSIASQFKDGIGAALELPPYEPLSVSDFVDSVQDALAKHDEVPNIVLKGMGEVTFFQVLDSVKAVAGTCPDIKFPPPPPLECVDTLKKIVDALSSIELPKFDGDLGIELPKIDIPGIPKPNIDLPAPPIPGIGKLFKLFKGPKKPSRKEIVLRPRLDKYTSENCECPDGSPDKQVAHEISWVLYGLARAYNKPFYLWRPWTSTFYQEQSTGAMLYNKLGKGASNKPEPAE